MKRKVIIGSLAVGLAASTVLLALLSRRAPAPTPPDAYQDFGPVAHALGKPATLRKQPADALEAVFEAVAAGRRHELSNHFADPWDAEGFYSLWAGEIPVGPVRVVRADDVNAGAENGHIVPVIIWIEGAEEPGGVVGLKGDASFDNGSDGVRIRDLNLTRLPLQVSTWASAADRIRQGAAQPRRLEGPFYGTFHLAVDKQHFTVDAETGKVERE